MWYQKAADGEFTHRLSQHVLDKFGEPDSKRLVKNGELWIYAPVSVDHAVNAKNGEVVGITFHINKYGGVESCTGVRRGP